MKNPFNFSIPEILQSELDAIHEALIFQEIQLSEHAAIEADAENIPLVAILETIFVGTAVSKDQPQNPNNRVPGINFEHKISDGRWIRTKVAWINNFLIITVHTI
jgi:hypothetical protein